MTKKKYDLKKDERYLRLLAKSFPNIAEASTEIINLEAIAHLPKGTEHFLADIHGEYQAFQHVLKNASGNIKRKVNELFGERLRNVEKQELCTLIYYPAQKLELVKKQEKDIKDWYHITIHRLVEVCRDVSSKYTRSKVRKSLPADFSYIIQELLHEHADDKDKTDYVSAIIKTIISTGRADDFIIAICEVIQRLVIDQLHILGDMYDRGPGAHIVMDTLKNYHNWDITWVTMTSYGWERLQVTTLVSVTSFVLPFAMLTWQLSRTDMVLILSSWPPSQWMSMVTIHARSSSRRCQRQSARRA